MFQVNTFWQEEAFQRNTTEIIMSAMDRVSL